MFRHVVSIKVKEDKKNMIEKAKSMILALDEIKEVIKIEAGINEIESARSYDIVLIADFDTKEDCDIYDVHSLHKPVKDFVGEIAEKVVSVDYTV